MADARLPGGTHVGPACRSICLFCWDYAQTRLPSRSTTTNDLLELVKRVFCNLTAYRRAADTAMCTCVGRKRQSQGEAMNNRTVVFTLSYENAGVLKVGAMDVRVITCMHIYDFN